MGTNIKLKEAYDVESKYGAFYTGGNIVWYKEKIYCQTSSAVNILNIEDGQVAQIIGEEDSEDSDHIQTFTTDGLKIVSSHRSGLLKLWNEQGQLVKIWKYIHKGPIGRLQLKNTLLASGGSDGILRIWDLDHQACIRSFKGCQGVINVVEIVDDASRIYASGDDGNILSWNLVDNNDNFFEYKSHFSKVTSMIFSHDQQNFVSSGRDKVIILWKIGEKSPLKIIPTYESIEDITRMPANFKTPGGVKSEAGLIYVASGGEFGLIRIWDVVNSREVYKQQNSLITKAIEGGLAVTKILCDEKAKSLAVISVDHNIILHHIKSFVCLKQFIGYQDEILDLALLGDDETHLALATNSCDIKLYDATMNCQLLKGHTDIVLALSTSKTEPNLLVSSAKDNQIRLWFLEDNQINCIGIAMGHTASIASTSLPNTSAQFLVSVSQDTCLKYWQLPSKIGLNKEIMLNCTATEMAHNKDINYVTISPNDKIIATASQDKTAKLWTDSLTFVGTLKGHKRGVWCIKFSPIDQVVLTSSADCTLKLWSIADLSCLKTFEGHESSVLKHEFLSGGFQFISAGADGLLKLFNIKSSECITTLDQHEGRIWALTVNKDESLIITGGSDSSIIKWKDVTEIRKLERLKEQEEETLQQQKLMNYLQSQQLLKALKLALKLDRPLQTLKIIQGIIRKNQATGLADTIRELRNDQKEKLWDCATNWNTNSKNCQSAQLVLNVLINDLNSGDFKPLGLRNSLEGALPYTERHFKRLTELLQSLHFINYTTQIMQPHVS